MDARAASSAFLETNTCEKARRSQVDLVRISAQGCVKPSLGPLSVALGLKVYRPELTWHQEDYRWHLYHPANIFVTSHRATSIRCIEHVASGCMYNSHSMAMLIQESRFRPPLSRQFRHRDSPHKIPLAPASWLPSSHLIRAFRLSIGISHGDLLRSDAHGRHRQ